MKSVIKSVEVMERICVRVANGETIRRISEDPDMPTQSGIMKWIAQDLEFKAMYETARLARADARADEIDQLIHRMLEGEIDAQAAKVAIDAQKWLMAKENAKRYGDRVDVNTEVSVRRMPDDELDAQIAAKLALVNTQISGALGVIGQG